MKLDLNLKFLKPKKKFKKDDHIINPNIYWRMVVYVGLTTMFISFVFGFYLFKQISVEPEVPESAVINNAQKIKKERLNRALNYFKDQNKVSEEILNNPSKFKDPSINTKTPAVPSVGIEPTLRP